MGLRLITFETDGQGRATALVLHQNGINQPAKRIQQDHHLERGHTQDEDRLRRYTF
jgi:hypothetical protein